MPLFKGGAFHNDPWIAVDDQAALPEGRDIIIGKVRFLAEADALLGWSGRLGVVLVAGETVDGLVPHLGRLALIVLRIPKYSDGRFYSIARLLRDRHGFRGELRASGDVLRDQVLHLLRAGFDALDVTHAGTIEALRLGTIVAVHHHYQPASAETVETRPNQRPWRRISNIETLSR
jgi:uncharacterized protein (DUF934 family)